ncbi:MAG: gliding motility protein GldM [Cytophagales bacterium]|nr:gliding motility protein GldM [Cytophagales bacterium]
MAAVKETPRQKMIGMMYLVLTALLALNVSSSVLDKFIIINQSLEETAREKVKLNQGVLDRVSKAVSEAGNRDKDVAVLEKAKKVREESERVTKELIAYKEMFIEVSGGRDENDNLLGKNDVDVVSSLMNSGMKGSPGIDPKFQGKNGVAMENLLNEYAGFLNEITNENRFHAIAQGADSLAVFKDDPAQKGKNFVDLNFGYNTPMVGGLATVSEFQNRVLSYEGIALEALARKVGAGDIKFDQIVAMVRPESRVVAAGARYKAELFIAASSSAIDPEMTFNGRPLNVQDGKGLVEFIATPPGSYNENGLAEKAYETAITIKLPGGQDTTFTSTQKYFVAQPVIQIQSASVQALYLNCGNELDVQVPSLGTNYDPVFQLSGGGQVIKGARKGQITIIPRATEVTLSVSSGGNKIGSQNFKVKRIPRPEIKVYSNGREVDQKKGVKRAPRSLNIRAVSDESFEQFLPKDARFRVTGAEIALVRAGRAVSVTRATSGKISIANLAAQARPGDAIVIEVKNVQRLNFRKDIEPFYNFGPRIINIRVN